MDMLRHVGNCFRSNIIIAVNVFHLIIPKMILNAIETVIGDRQFVDMF